MNSYPAAKTPPPALHGIAPGIAPGPAPDDQPRAMAQQWARQESAMHCVRLAVQRWRTGYAAADSAVPSSQERWFAEVHGHFTAWLTAGGFAQDGAEATEGALAATGAPVRVDTPLPAEGPAPAAADRSGAGAHENSGTKPPFPCPA